MDSNLPITKQSSGACILNITRNSGYAGSPDILVSIVTPVYNRRHLLQRTFASVRAQTVKCFEHVIVDDGSTDDPGDVIFNYMTQVDYPVAFIRKENGGVHSARNAALDIARGGSQYFSTRMTKSSPMLLR